MDVDVSALEVNNLAISKPRKTDESLFAGMRYDGKKLALHFYNVDVINHKIIPQKTNPYSVLQIRVPKASCKKMLDFDANCIEQVQNNVSSWFTKSLDENVIEEFYTSSCIIQTSTPGFVVKLKLQGNDTPIETHMKYDLVIFLKGLRFYKQRFITEWELFSAKVLNQDIVNDFVSDTEDTEKMWEMDFIEEDIVPEPDFETLQSIQENMQVTVKQALADAKQKYRAYSAHIKSLRDLRSDLGNERITVRELDRISEHVEKLLSCL